MCFQYKWSRSRKGKIKGKGQTKQIKLASLPDFNINYHGFGKDSSISSLKFFSQERRIFPQRREIMTGLKTPKDKFQTLAFVLSQQSEAVGQECRPICRVAAGAVAERGTPRYTRVCFPGNTLEGGNFHQPHQPVFPMADTLTLWPPAVIRGLSPFLRLRVTSQKSCSQGMRFRQTKQIQMCRRTGPIRMLRPELGCLALCLFKTQFIGARKFSSLYTLKCKMPGIVRYSLT